MASSLKNANEDEDRQPGCFGLMRIPPGLQNKTMHLLPFGTNYTGPAPVADYFKHKAAGTNEDGIEMKEGAFRGRKFMGSTLPLPEGFCGFVLKKELAPTLENGRARVKVSEKEAFDIWEADSNFGEFTYWNHDTLPSKADHIRTVMEWLPVSAALHGDVTADEVAAMAKKMGLQPGPSPSTAPSAGSKRKL